MDPTGRFAALVADAPGEIPLDLALALIAARARPRVDPDALVGRLDDLAASCAAPTVPALRRHLFETLGFHGNRADYHDPDNSLLDQVLERRTGLPITLSVVTVEVGRRLGLHLAGVAMPGHFLVADLDHPGTWLDPFDGGAELDREGVGRLFGQVHGPGAALEDRHLTPAGPVDVLARVLNNLRATFQGHAAHRRRDGLAWVLELQATLPGATLQVHRELAAARAALGRFADAADHLERVAADVGDDDAALGLRGAAKRLRGRLN